MLGGGITVTLHRNGKVIDSNNGVGGDGPFTPERVGSCPGFQLVDLCYSGEYSKAEIKKKLMGKGGAVAFFGTNDLKEIVRRGEDGDVRAKVWMEAFVLNIAKYIASEAADVCGKVDVILLTGGGAYGRDIVSGIRKSARGWSSSPPLRSIPESSSCKALPNTGTTFFPATPPSFLTTRTLRNRIRLPVNRLSCAT